LSLIGIVGILASSLAINNAHATSSITAIGAPYSIGNTGQFQICVDNAKTLNLAFLVDPNGNIVWNTAPSWTLSIPTNSCAIINPGSLGFTGFNMAGDWIFVTADINNNTIKAVFAVTFLVLPEAPIGAIAIIGSGIATIAAYKLRK